MRKFYTFKILSFVFALFFIGLSFQNLSAYDFDHNVNFESYIDPSPNCITIFNSGVNCDYTESDQIQFSINPASPPTGFSNIFYLSDLNGVILESSNSTSFNSQSAGAYKVIALNYENGTAGLPGVGDNINDIDENKCTNYLTKNVYICPAACTDIFCDDKINIGSNSQNNDANFTDVFILVNENNEILDFKNDASLLNVPSTDGTYFIFSINYENSSPPEEITIGNPFTEICIDSEACFELGNVSVFSIDKTAPIISCPNDSTFSCKASLDNANLPIATYTDLCNTNLTPTFNDDLSQYSAVKDSGRIFRTWKIKDDCGNEDECIQILTIVPVNITGTPNTPPSSCDSNNGNITIVATAPSDVLSTLEYSINGGSSFSSSNEFTGLGSNKYNIVVRTSDGHCTFTDGMVDFTVAESPTINSITPTDITDCDLTNGSITILASGNGNSISYSIDDGQTYQTSNVFAGLSEDTYSVKVKYTNGTCESGGENTVIEAPEKPKVTGIGPIQNPSDCGLSDGFVTIQATGNQDIEYQLVGVRTWQTSPTFSNLPAGNYTLQVRYTNGTCLVTNSQNIVLQDPLCIPECKDIFSRTVLCDYKEGTITFSVENDGNASNGFATKFVLTSLTGEIIQNSDNPTFSNVKSGVYYVAAVNYELPELSNTFDPGQNIFDLNLSCYDVNYDNVGVCPENDCDYLVCEDNINLNIQGGNVSLNTVYALVNESNVILDVRNDLNFNFPESGKFFVFAFNIDNVNNIDGLVANSSLSGVCINEDACYDISSIAFEIDDEKPTIVCPSVISVKCDESTDPSNTGNPTVGGGCESDNSDLTVEYEDTVYDSPNCETDDFIQRITREWKVSDACGNTATCSQTIFIKNEEKPVLNCVAPLILECDGNYESEIKSWLESITATAKCGLVVDITNNYQTGSLPALRCSNNLNGLTVFFTATDQCGNSSSCSSEIVIEDTKKPVISCVEDLILECDGDYSAEISTWLSKVTATDACGGCDFKTNEQITASISGNTPSGTTNIYVLTDNLGNILAINQSSPIFSGRVNGTYFIYALNYVQSKPVTGVTIGQNIADVDGDCFDVSQSRSITVCDNTVKITDDYTNGSIPASTCIGQSGGLTVTFTAEDNCGNTAECTAVIRIEDTKKPVISCVEDLILECDGDYSAEISSWLAKVTATDACGGCDFKTNEQITASISGNTPSGTTNIYVLTDNLGNILAINQSSPIFSGRVNGTYFIYALNYDQSKPVTGVTIGQNIADVDGDCFDVSQSRSITVCDNTIKITNDYTNGSIPASTCIGQSGGLIVTFTAEDNCGNTAECTAVIRIEDTKKPVISCVGDLILECDGDYNSEITSWLAKVTATDACGGCDFKTNEQITASISGNTPSGTTNIYVLTDNLGNILAINQSSPIFSGRVNGTYFIYALNYDQSKPVTGVTVGQNIADVDGDCFDVSQSRSITVCDNTVKITNDYTNGSLPSIVCSSQQGGLTVTFTATDECNNTSICTAEIKIVDTQDPVISCVGDLILECDGDYNSEITSWLSKVTATDACDSDVKITNNYTNGSLPSIVCSSQQGGLTVTFTATDECNNTSICTAEIKIVDTQDPVISCVGDLILECDGDYNSEITSWLSKVTATDACDSDVKITNNYTNGSLPSIVCSSQQGGLTVTFTATDECNNTSICTAEIKIVDTQDPVISCVGDLILECDGDYNSEITSWLSKVTATDACDSDVKITNNYTNGSLPSIVCSSQQGGLTVTFTATDECNNTSICTAEIKIVDTQDPVISCVGDLILECDGDYNSEIRSWLSKVTATDACDSDVKITNNYTNGSLPSIVCSSQQGGLTVTFTATDECNNTSICTAEIKIVDTQDPVISCVGDLILECDGDYNSEITSWLSKVTATDACDSDVKITNNYTNGSLPSIVCSSQQGGLTVTFTATDECNNTSICTAEIKIVDTQDPVISCVGDLILECDGDYNSEIRSWLSKVTATDACDSDVKITNNYTNGSLPSIVCSSQQGGLTVTFTATDECNNTSICTAEIKIVDTQDPVISCVGDLILECDGDYNSEITSWLSKVTATDACDSDVKITNNYTNGSLPSIVCSSQQGGLTVTFTATDECNNTSICTAEIKIVDTQDPVISCVGDLILECDGDYNSEIRSWLSKVTATDACDSDVKITNNYTNGSLPSIVCSSQQGGLTVTFTATDECNNTSICTAEIKIVDTQDPVISCVGDLILECDGDYNSEITSWLSKVTATDACDSDVKITNNYTNGSLPSIVCSSQQGGLTVTFTATDECNNTSICTAEIKIVDTQDPVISCVGDLILECDGDYNSEIRSWLSKVTATDACDSDVKITNNYTNGSLPSIVCSSQQGGLTVTFTATDECNNTSICTAEIKIVDTQDPVISCVGDLILECDGDYNSEITSWLSKVTATDACDSDVKITNNYTNGSLPSIVCSSQQGGLTVTFTATDECNNTSICTAEIKIVDTQDPVISCVGDLILECDGDYNSEITSWLSKVTATDACDSDVKITNNYTNGSLPSIVCSSQQGGLTVTFTATDECNNTSICTAEIKIVDTQDPVISCVGDLILECDGDYNSEITSWLSKVTATDACDSDVKITNNYTNGSLPSIVCSSQQGGLTVTFTATDECNNTSICTAEIKILDTQDPVISCVGDLILECDGDYNSEITSWLSKVTATDACDSDVKITNNYTNGSLPSIVCSSQQGGLTVTFTATDECNNTSICTAEIKILDTQDPVISCVGDLILECDGDYNSEITSWLSKVTATDACDSDVKITNNYTNGSLPSIVCSSQQGGLTVTFTATDECNNTSICTAEIKIVDTQDPVISCVGDLILECDGDYNSEIASWLSKVTATDACDSDVKITNNYTNGSLPSIVCSSQQGGLTVTFTATDECNNTSICTAEIKIVDTQDPVISCVGDLILECDGDYNSEITSWLSKVTATDACDSDVKITNNYTNGSLPSVVCSSQQGGLTVTFTATDECNNTSICTAEIKIVDTQDPVISCVGDLILECDGDYNSEITSWLSKVTATDACDSDVKITNNYTNGSLPSVVCSSQQGGLTVTFTATDECNNTSICTAEIKIVDTQDPVISCVGDLILECDGDYNSEITSWLSKVTATDACDSDVKITNNYTNGSLPSVVCSSQQGGLTVTFTATDECNNTSICTAEIKIVDTQDPVISCVGDLILECDGDYNSEITSWLSKVTATDACDSDVKITNNYTNGSLPSIVCSSQQGGLTVTFTATDECNNTSICTAEIKIVDTQDPVISCVGDLILECDGDYNSEITSWLSKVTATDACDSDVKITNNYTNGSLPSIVCSSQQGGLTVTFTATDECNNTSICTAEIKIVDTQDPVISCVGDLILECDGDYNSEITSWLSKVTATDACDSDVKITNNYTNGSLPSVVCSSQQGGLTVTFTATDECNNTSICTAEIKIVDTQDPVISCVGDLILECDGDYNSEITSWLSKVTATDACDSDVKITNNYTNGSLPSIVCSSQQGGLTVTFTATDECNNTSICTAEIKIVDTQDPVISCVGDLILECDGDYNSEITSWLSKVTATDACDSDVKITNNYTNGSLPSIVCSSQQGGLTVTFTATDECNNTSICTAEIKIVDTQDPVISCVGDLILECDGDYNSEITSWLSKVTATDACDSDVKITNNYTNGSLPSIVCSSQQGGLTVTFTATDECNNTSICTAEIKIVDTQDPVISCVGDLILECDGDYNSEITSWLSKVTATDACDSDVKITNNYTNGSLPSVVCSSQQGGLTVTFTATDECNNTSICTAEIKIVDTQDPVISCVGDLILECDGDYSSEITSWLSKVTATDACDSDVKITNNYTNGSLPSIVCSSQQGGLTVTFTATDECNNTSICTAEIKIVDTQDPVISCVGDLILECDGDYNSEITSWLSKVTATDACDSDVKITNNYTNGSLPSIVCSSQQGGLTVTFTATDECNNTSICTAEIKIVDTQDPVISCVGDLILECDGDYNSEITSWLSKVTATDACDSDVKITNNYTNGSLPSIVCSSQQGGLTVTFTATDECNNTSICTAEIKIVDTQDPVISCVGDLILECDGDYNSEITSWLSKVTATDACDSDVKITNNYTNGSLPSIVCSSQQGGLTVTFTATDECNNTSICTAEIKIVDTQDPVISCVGDLILECDGDYNSEITSWLSKVTATDACDSDVKITNNYTNGSLPSVVCSSQQGGLTVTFTATDECNNTSICTAEIKIVDTQDPVISCVGDLILECDGDYNSEITSWLSKVTATDACDSDVKITNNYTNGSLPSIVCSSQQGGLTVTFTATDECNNTSICTAEIKIVDTQDPVISCVGDLILECDGDYNSEITSWLSKVTATDACDSDVKITNNYTNGSLPSIVCSSQQGGLTVTFTATDECNNTSICTAEIKIVDTQDPVISCVGDLILECDGDYNSEITSWLSKVTATDACDSDVKITNNYTNGSLPNIVCSSQQGGLTVTFTATDECNNTSICTAEIKIVDTQDPVISCVGDLILECDGDYSSEITSWLSKVTATDACDSDVKITNNYTNGSLPSIVCSSQQGGLTVTFTATDECNNTSICTAEIKIVDTQDPVISCVGDLILECDGDYNSEITSWLSKVTATDACDSDVKITNNYTNGSLPSIVCSSQQGGLTVTFTATDECNNTSICTAEIKIVDTQDPVISCVGDLILECDGDYNSEITSWLSKVTATDACDSDVKITNNYTNGSLPSIVCSSQQGGLTVTFTATDECNNTSICTAEIKIVDTQDPVISCVGDLILECDGDYNSEITSWLSKVTATDACDSDVKITNNYTNGSLPSIVCSSQQGGLTVTFTATDECNNTSICTAEIKIVDTQDPVISCVGDLILECDGDYNSEITSWLSKVTATDACDSDVKITNNYTNGSLPSIVCSSQQGGLTVTFTATDECNNTSICTAEIKIVDTQDPVISCVGDLILECDGDYNSEITSWLSKVTATDACDSDVKITNNYTNGSLPSIVCSSQQGGLTVTFTATDECNNTSICTAEIKIVDTQDPVISCVGDLILECDGDYNSEITSWLSKVTATDACGGCDFKLNEQITASLSGSIPSGTKNIFVITNSSGDILEINQSSPIFTGKGIGRYFIYALNYDENKPVTGVTIGQNIADVNGDCFDVSQSRLIIVCDNIVTITNNYTNGSLPDISCSSDENGLEVIFTATDHCGNTATCSAQIIINPIPLTIHCPSDKIIAECSDQSSIVGEFNLWKSSFVATGGCNSQVETSQSGDIPTSCNGGSIVVTFKVTDNCGSKSCTATFTVHKKSAPVFDGLIPDKVIGCGDVFEFTTPQYIDECGTANLTFTDKSQEGSCVPERIITRTWTISDECGNSATTSASIIIKDTEEPILPNNLPQNITVSCSKEIPSIPELIAQDECVGPIKGKVTENEGPKQCPNNYEIVRQWTFEDECGNVSRHQQIITVKDEIDPQWINLPMDLSLNCTDNIDNVIQTWLDSGGNGLASDNCGVATITNDYQRTAITCENPSKEVTFFANDGCGNVITASAQIILIDNENPVLSQLQNKVVDCDDAVVFDTPTVNDNCDNNVDLTFTDSGEFGICKDGSMTRTWIATDACGNTTIETQTITRTEECGPDDNRVERTICSEDLPFNFFGQNINAGGTYTSEQVDNNGCPYLEILVLTVTPKAGDITTRRTVCATDLPYVFNGVSYDAGGTYRQESGDCTADQVLVLTVTPKAGDVTTRRTVCATDLPYVFNGVSYDAGGTYRQESGDCTADQVLVLTVTPKAGDVTTRRTVCATDLPYVFNGVSYDASGTYRQSSEGCTADQVLVLTVTPKAGDVTTRRTVCATDLPYVFNGVSYDASGTYRQSSEGCTADQVLVLTVTPKAGDVTTRRTVCATDLPYVFNGVSYDASGTYRQSSEGCTADQVLVLTVTPKAGDVTTRRTVCAVDLPYVFNGVSYDAGGTYRQSSEGCTADQVLVLTVTPKAGDVTTRRTVCAADLPYVFNGVAYDASGTYRQSSEGCTADQVLVLTVTPKAGDVTTRRTVCATGLPYVFNGVSYDASGTYRQSSEGCTADQVLVLTVTPKAGDVTTRRTVCATDLPYVFNGVSYDASGTYRQSSEGCTADQVLVLTVTPKAGDVTTRRTVCAADLPYVFNGVSYDASGTYRQSSEGCTADQVLVLTVTPKAGDVTTRRTVCATDLPYVFNGVSYDASGTYRQSSEGCTADQVLVLTVTPKAGDVTTRRTVCATDLPYVFNGVSYDASGTYRQSSEGCTADQVLVLTVTPKAGDITTRRTVCATDLPYVFNGVSYDASGTYRQSSEGCTADQVLVLTVTPKAGDVTTRRTVCATDLPYVFNGVSYDASGTYRQSSEGCTADQVLVLTVTPKAGDVTTRRTVCATDLPYVFNGVSYDASGTYRQSSEGCTADQVLVLTVTPKAGDITTRRTVCATDLPYVFNGVSYDASGTYRLSSEGCTADQVLVLTVTPKAGDVTTRRTVCATDLPYVFNGVSYDASGTYRQSSEGCTADQVLVLSVIDKCNIVTEASDLTLTCSSLNSITIQGWIEDNANTILSCSNSTVSHDYDGTMPTCDNPLTVTFTFGNLSCGDALTSTAQIILIDNDDPIIQNAPSNIVADCIEPVGQPLTAIDNCAGTITAEPVDVRTDGNCANRYLIERTWTFSDDCGNTVSHTQIINVTDDVSPVFTDVPGDIDVANESEVPEATEPTASDNCGTVNIRMDEERGVVDCGVIITRVWTATDACGNTSTASQIINVGIDLEVNTSVITNVSCFGSTDGSAEVLSAESGLTYLWSNGETTRMATQLGVGSHSVTVEASNGCRKVLTVQISQPEALDLDIINIIDANCLTNTLGSAEVTVEGGVGPFTYEWTNGTTTATLSGVTSGRYSVVVTDANGCTEEGSVDIGSVSSCNAELGDVVFEDLNRNGIQDENDPRIEGVTVILLDRAGNEINRTVTDENGMYWFSGLGSGEYILQFITPEGYISTIANGGVDDGLDSDVSIRTGLTEVITLGEGESNKTIDAGYYQNGSIGNYVWHDEDRDGLQDENELGKEGVKIWLLDETLEAIASTFTDENGYYIFNNIPPGVYYIELESREGIIFSSQNVGDNDDIDSDLDPNTLRTEVINLLSGENYENIDIGCNKAEEIIDLELEKSVSNGRPQVGESIVFTLKLTNKGPNDATGVEVEDIVPNGYGGILAISNGGSQTENVINWTDITLDAGKSIELKYRTSVLAQEEGMNYKNVAQVTASDQEDIDSTPDNDDGDQSEDDEDSAMVFVSTDDDYVDVSLTKEVDDSTPDIKDVITYTIRVRNDGNVPATEVEVTDYLPTAYCIEFINISNGGVLSGDKIIWSGLDLEPGESIELTFQATVAANAHGETVTNIAEVTSHVEDDIDSTPGNNDASEDDQDGAIFQVGRTSDLSLDKRIVNPSAGVGDVVKFEIELTNNGPDPVTFAEVEDVVPDGYADYANISHDGITYTNVIRWMASDLEVGESVIYTFDARVVHFPDVDCDYKNVAQVTRSTSNDPDSEPNNDNGDQSEDDEDWAELDVGQTKECIEIKSAVILEGGYDDGLGRMHTTLNQLGYLPGQKPTTFFGSREEAGQPYSQSPWFYGGSEGEELNSNLPEVGDFAGYPEDAVDYVLVSLRTDNSPESEICERAALVLQNGELVFFEDENCCDLNPQGSYYLVIQHRNHLPVMSHEKVAIVDGVLSYDFRIQNSYKSVLGLGQKEIKSGLFAMFAGNGDQQNGDHSREDINFVDLGVWMTEDGANSGYYLRDYDLNGDVNVHDKVLFLKNNGAFTDVRF